MRFRPKKNCLFLLLSYIQQNKSFRLAAQRYVQNQGKMCILTLNIWLSAVKRTLRPPESIDQAWNHGQSKGLHHSFQMPSELFNYLFKTARTSILTFWPVRMSKCSFSLFWRDNWIISVAFKSYDVALSIGRDFRPVQSTMGAQDSLDIKRTVFRWKSERNFSYGCDMSERDSIKCPKEISSMIVICLKYASKMSEIWKILHVLFCFFVCFFVVAVFVVVVIFFVFLFLFFLLLLFFCFFLSHRDNRLTRTYTHNHTPHHTPHTIREQLSHVLRP